MKKLVEFLENNNILVDNNFVNKCEQYINLLLEWGGVHNLVSNNSLNKETIIENIIDSIYPLKFLNSFDNFVDIGTGAGYPGLILAFALNKEAILVEPKEKRVAFLNFVKNVTKSKNITILQKRAQDISGYKADLITSRAVTKIDLLLSITQNLVKDDSEFLFYKGSSVVDEIEKANISNYDIISYNNRNYLYIKRKDLFC